MSAELRHLRDRLAVQERLTTSLSGSVEEIASQLQEITVTMATREDIKQLSASVDDRFKQLSASVDQRFEHVYGELADIKSNTLEIRNILATLVERLNKPN